MSCRRDHILLWAAAPAERLHSVTCWNGASVAPEEKAHVSKKQLAFKYGLQFPDAL